MMLSMRYRYFQRDLESRNVYFCATYGDILRFIVQQMYACTLQPLHIGGVCRFFVSAKLCLVISVRTVTRSDFRQRRHKGQSRAVRIFPGADNEIAGAQNEVRRLASDTINENAVVRSVYFIMQIRDERACERIFDPARCNFISGDCKFQDLTPSKRPPACVGGHKF